MEENHKEEKEEHVIEHQKTHKIKVSFVNQIKDNPWILGTLVFGLLAIVLLIGNFSITGHVSKDTAGKNFVNYINEMGDTQIEFVNAEHFGSSLYQVIVLANGEEIPAYITSDGMYFVQIISALKEEVIEEPIVPEDVAKDIPKSDKPLVELFIWSYCPYGVLAQGPLSEVVELLGDSIEAVPVLYYAGHGEYELQQNKIQSCIYQNYSESYWEYAKRFVNEIYPVCGSSRDVECDLNMSVEIMDELGIDSTAILACVDSQGDDLYQSDYNYAKSFGVTGSPTLMINGVKVSVDRNAEAFKGAICSAFDDVPELCGEVLDSSSSVASGNC